MQFSLAEFINSGEYRAHVNRIRQQLSQQVYSYRRFLIEQLPAHTKVSVPDGGLVLWLQVPGMNAQRLEQEVHELGVDIRSGACFSTHDTYQDCLRINCGWPLADTGDKSCAYQQLSRLCLQINGMF